MKVAIYCRLSEEDRNKQSEADDSGSIQNQKSMLLQYALEQNWEVHNIYSDDDYAGADRNRPAFNRLLEEAQQHKFDIILCKTQSRFTRELELVEKYIHGLFPLWGIRFISIVDNADTANKGNKKSRQINGLVNEWYLEDMSENIRSVLTNKRQNGHHIGAFALYGYQKDPEKHGHLVVDEEAAAIVREVFVLFSKGYGKTAIARILNDRGIPNPTEYKRQKGLRYAQPKQKNSTLWKYFAISDMLTNEIYIGNMVQGKYGSVSYKTKQNKPRPRESWYIVRNTHEAIIAQDLWDQVQKLVCERAKPFEVGSIGLFARKVRCAHCGYTLCSSKNRGKHYLQCSNRHVSKDACIGCFISVDLLEKRVLEELHRLSQSHLNKDALEQKIEVSNDLLDRKARITTDIATIEKRIHECDHVVQNLYMDKVRGILSEADFVLISNSNTEKRERLEQSLSTAHTQVADVDAQLACTDLRRQLMEKYLGIKHLTREMVEVLIEYITVEKRPKGVTHAPIEIHWNF